MKNYQCECGNTLYFANSTCLSCQRPVGFISQEMTLSACEIDDNGHWISCLNGKAYRPCTNYSKYQVCNWLIPAEEDHSLCESCQLTETIPDLSKPDNLSLWFRMEKAKRQLIYTLSKLGLDVWKHGVENANELRFRFLEDETEEDEYGEELTVKSTVITGHCNGVITLNLKEAEDASRLKMREQMNERYRTLIGHFRHESGHYYWDTLVQNSPYLEKFRSLFGDERQDYTKSMQLYYANGPVQDWQSSWISAYASMHPWEDWAESWAHYLHIVDTLETATEYSINILQNRLGNPLAETYRRASETDFQRIFEDWCRLTTVLNALNRSMGQDDAYPFVISYPALQKLSFIHDLLHQRL
ncbi:MAG: hypothetical protein CL587_01075 [Alteromonadaceae bacterium]|nr:hypothetical protein [Alteromonadaceae bacterium]